MRGKLLRLRSFRTRMVLVLLGCIACYLLFTLLMNSLLLKPYYTTIKERSLSSYYQQILDMDFDDDDTTVNEIEALCENSNMRVLIFAETGKSFFDGRVTYGQYYCSPGFSDSVTLVHNSSVNLGGGEPFNEWLMSDSGNSTNAASINFTEKPQFNISINRRTSSQYLSLYVKHPKSFSGQEYSFYFILNTPIAAIDDGVRASNSFAMIIALCVLSLGGIATFIVASRVVRPVIHASEIAKKMSLLDFSQRLEVSSADELGQLAESINTLSDELESKINQLSITNSQLKRELTRKDRIDQMRREFVSDVSHELKTPLSIIMGYCEGLQFCSDKADQEYYCTVIQDEAMRMNRLAMRLLKLAELESGELEPQLSAFSLGDLAGQRLEKLSVLLAERSIQSSIERGDISPVWGDRERIEEVIDNLLSNARNHTPDNGSITVSVAETADSVRCSVRNTGSHIPDESLDRIWDSFYKVDKARSRSYGGSGLGLKIVSTILQSHDAGYDAKNLDDGVEFSFTLKKATAEQLAQTDDEDDEIE